MALMLSSQKDERSPAKKKRVLSEKARASQRLRSARYYAKHKAECKERMRCHHAATRERTRVRKLLQRRENPDKARSRWRQAYWNNPEKSRTRRKQWAQAHPEQVRARNQRYYAANSEKVINLQQAREANKRHAPHNDLTAAQWREIKEHYGHRCVYCGKQQQRLTMDHLTPLSRGGSHTASNIVPACRSCNSRKHAGPVLTAVQPLLLTVSPARLSTQGERHVV